MLAEIKCKMKNYLSNNPPPIWSYYFQEPEGGNDAGVFKCLSNDSIECQLQYWDCGSISYLNFISDTCFPFHLSDIHLYIVLLRKGKRKIGDDFSPRPLTRFYSIKHSHHVCQVTILCLADTCSLLAYSYFILFYISTSFQREILHFLLYCIHLSSHYYRLVLVLRFFILNTWYIYKLY